MALERSTKEGESPVSENGLTLFKNYYLSTAPYGDWAGSRENYTPKAKYSQNTDSEPVP